MDRTRTCLDLKAIPQIPLAEQGGMLKGVDARTQLAGSNRMEILLFSLGTPEVFGINVFKVREVIPTPPITRAPNLPQAVEGLINLRGNVIPVVALGRFAGISTDQSRCETMMITEFSRHMQGFLVHDVDRIVRVEWQKVRAVSPTLTGEESRVTAITELPDGKLVSILDVEQILVSVFGETVMPDLGSPQTGVTASILFADDSLVARKEITQVLDHLGIPHQQASNGAEAWDRLQALATQAQTEGVPLRQKLGLILTDAEMPEMDGYVLTRQVKADPRFAGIPVVMHSSLSTDANRALGKSVGVDVYVPKFAPMELAATLLPLLAVPVPAP